MLRAGNGDSDRGSAEKIPDQKNIVPDAARSLARNQGDENAPAQEAKTGRNAWQARCQELTQLAWDRFATKKDRHGIYSPNGRAEWSYSELTEEDLCNHFAGNITLGCGATSLEDQCLWNGWDLDNHVSETATNQNLEYALVLQRRLEELGADCMVEDSDGKGGIHVWLLFSEPVPSADAYRFAKWVAEDHQDYVDKIECFPKSPTVQHTEKNCGHYLRLPGKHHKREHWSRLWGDGEWLDDESSVELFLNPPINAPAILAHAPPAEPPKERTKYNGPRSDTDALVRQALPHIPNEDYDTWIQVGQSLHSEGDHLLGEWEHWSQSSEKYNPGECQQKWKTFSRSEGGRGIGTVFHLAEENGWFRQERETYANIETTETESGSVDDTDNTTQERSYSRADRNDIGNADAFARQHADRLRYVHPWKNWLVWDSARWRPDDDGTPTRSAIETVRRMFRDGLARQDKRILTLASKSAQSPRLQAMIAIAGSKLPVKVEELDQNEWLLNCPNGTVDLRTGDCHPHKRWQYITKLCATAYDPDAPATQWQQFLRDVFVDSDLIAFVQRLLGYCLTGDVTEQKLPIFHGSGANGKSTLLNAFMSVVGTDYTMQAQPDLLLEKRGESHPTGMAALFGKRFVNCAETGQSRKLAESTVKMLTGGERIQARRMRENFWEFMPTHKLVLCTNHRPIITGTDHGIWRRLLLVPFTQRFEGARVDTQLPRKLEAEAPGILAWLVRGCRDWQRDGLNPPECVQAATNEYRTQEDIIGRFVEERCERNRSGGVRFAKLYATFEQWCEDTGDFCPTKRKVGQWLKDQGFEAFSANGRCYRGIDLRADP